MDITMFCQRIAELAPILPKKLQVKDSARVITQGTAFGDLHQDCEIGADQILGQFLYEFFLEFENVRYLEIEGLSGFSRNQGKWAVYVDPLDGSLNFKTARESGSCGLPYTVCVTILEVKTPLASKFEHIVGAVVIDLRNEDIWVAYKEADEFHTFFNGKPAKTRPETKVGIGKMIVFGEMYYPSNRERLCRMFPEEKGWLRNPGSAAYEMASVANGMAVAFICDQQKLHELGAGYALVRGAGGVAVGFFSGTYFIGDESYVFNSQRPVILAANKWIARDLWQRLAR